jgi:hypothetical protein
MSISRMHASNASIMSRVQKFVRKLWLPINIRWPYKLAFAIACLGAGADAISVAYNSGYLACSNSPGYLACMGFMDHHGTYLSTVNAMRGEITGAILVSVIGMYLKRRGGLMISALGFIGVILVYAQWYQRTLSDMRELEVPSFDALQGSGFQHVMPLRFATRLDVLILGLAVVLLIWHLAAGIRLIKIFSQTH